MARFSRILSGFDSSPAAAAPPEYVNVESDFVVILAALLCALICIAGLITVARCAWLRRTGPAASDFPPSAANKGLKKKILHSLPKFSYGSPAAVDGGPCKFEWTECAICLGEFCDGEVVRVLPQCGHGFHIRCIDTWLGSHSTCPSCRQILVVANCRKCGQFPAASDDCKARVHCVSDNGSSNQTSVVINNCN